MRQTTPFHAVLLLVLAGAVASSAIWPRPASAQSGASPLGGSSMPEMPAPTLIAPAPGAATESVPPLVAPRLDPTLDPAAARAARLDELFERLAQVDADGADDGADKVEAEIRRIWNRSGSDSMDLLLLRGRDALEDQDLVLALQHFGALTDHDPGFAEGWNMRATAFYLRGDLGQALADIEHVLALEPRHYGALTGLAVILEQLGRDADALKAWREAARINPHIEQAQEAIDRLSIEVDGRGI